MNAWMMALMVDAPQLVTQTITTSTTFVVPFGVDRLDTLVGNGAAGSPGTPDQNGWAKTTTTTFYRRDGGSPDTSSTQTIVLDGSPVPESYCDPVKDEPDSTVYYASQKCYAFHAVTIPGNPPTTGASATGFGKTFPGGTGGAATPVTYTDVGVTGGASYSIVIPGGGSITISYYQ